MTRRRSALIAALASLGAAAIVLGVLYLALRANSLPSVLGHLPTKAHRSRRGLAALGLGALLLAGATAVSVTRPRRSARAPRGSVPSRSGRASSTGRH